MDESRSFIGPPDNTTGLCPWAKCQQLHSLCDSVPLPTSTPPTFTHTSREIVVGSEKCVAISRSAAQREEEAITQTRSLQRDFKDVCWLLSVTVWVLRHRLSPETFSLQQTWIMLHFNYVAPPGSPAPQQNPYCKNHERNQWCNVPQTRSSTAMTKII